MLRYAERSLHAWYTASRRKPLVIRGARQVGKSTLVRNYAGTQGLQLHEINVERYPTLDAVFATLDPKKILPELEAVLGSAIKSKDSILFLDEVQATPNALPALRYFYEEMPELAVVCAGSLLEFVLEDHRFSMPVGRIQYLHVEPMTFGEYLLGTQEDFLHALIHDWSPRKELSHQAHLKLVDHYRRYLLIGGMPESVQVLQQQESILEAQRVHQEILTTYIDDFPKYGSKIDNNLLRSVLSAIPKQIGNKVKYAALDSAAKAGSIKNCIGLLSRARIINLVSHSTCSGVPLGAGENQEIQKLLYLDVGLLLSALGIGLRDLQSQEVDELVNKGPLAEQYIGQHLVYLESTKLTRKVFYWLREGKTGNAEVDFVIARGTKIFPIEVKAGKKGALRSLHQFMATHDGNDAIRFDLNPPSVQQVETTVVSKGKRQEVSYTLHSLPLYLVESLDRVIADIT